MPIYSSGTVTLFLGDIVPIPLPPAILFLTSGLVALISGVGVNKRVRPKTARRSLPLSG